MSSGKDTFNQHYICQHAWERLIIPQEVLEEAAGTFGCSVAPLPSDQDE